MTTDFQDAHRRHWEDAERLFTAHRWANADHLYGLATECGLKSIMKAFGMPVKPEGDPFHRQDRVHATDAWIRYETYRAGRPASYALPSENPFQDWDISQRYVRQEHFNEAGVNPHRVGADVVRQLIQQAALEGLI